MASEQFLILNKKITTKTLEKEFEVRKQSAEWESLTEKQKADAEFEYKMKYNSVRYFELFDELYLDAYISDEEIAQTLVLHNQAVLHTEKEFAKYFGANAGKISSTKSFANFSFKNKEA